MITLVAAARPNFMKVAPIWRELRRRQCVVQLLHAGQHTGEVMSDVFLRELGLPEPDVRLTIARGGHGEQTASVLVGVERAFTENRPEAVVVVGDVTSTLAAALAASKLHIPIVHVEAGLRSRNWSMPEEVNRVLTDRLSDLLLTTSPEAAGNLRAEGIDERRVRFVGNVMIDTLLASPRTDAVSRFGLQPRGYFFATLHRPSNVDSRDALADVISCLAAAAQRAPVVFPVHPRTYAHLVEYDLLERLARTVCITSPLGYGDCVTLMASALAVMTDSGGVQEETTVLGVPCLTLRDETERPITVAIGTNTVVGRDHDRLGAELDRIARGEGKRGSIPGGWDGHAAERAVDAIELLLRGEPPPLVSSAARSG